MADTATKVPVKTGSNAPTGTASAPWPPFDALRRQIDTLFDDFTPWNLRHRIFNVDLSMPFGNESNLAPATDVAEKENQYLITAELPGLDEKNIEVKLANGVLTIKGEKKEETEEKRKDYYLSERRFGSFFRSFEMPADVAADKIEASFSKGVLTVTLPKTPQAKANEKKIEVKAA